MKHVHTTEYNSATCGDSAERLHLYTLDSDEEYWELDAIEDPNELAQQADERFINEYAVIPGAIYHRYRAKLTDEFLIVVERIAYNI